MTEYVVMVDVMFLGVPVEAENEEEAREKALKILDSVAEYGLKGTRVIKVEEE